MVMQTEKYKIPADWSQRKKRDYICLYFDIRYFLLDIQYSINSKLNTQNSKLKSPQSLYSYNIIFVP